MTNAVRLKNTSINHAHRRRIILSYAVCWAIGIGLMLHWWGGVASADSRSGHYTVHAGDTLWSIAQTKMHGVDSRLAVNEIMKTNHMDKADIQPGDKIILPGN
jgi:LysM domain